MRSIGKITPDILNIFHQEAAVEQKRWILTFLKIHAAAAHRTFVPPAHAPVRTSQFHFRAGLFQSIHGLRLSGSAPDGYALAHSLYDHGWQESERQNGRHPDSDARSTSNHAVIIFRGGINVFRTVFAHDGRADSFRRSSCSLWSRTARIRTARSSKRE